MSVPTRQAHEGASVPCKNCSHEVKAETRRCPRCGQERPGDAVLRDTTRGLVAASVFSLIVIVLALLIFSLVL